jgi:hypothetical protein
MRATYASGVRDTEEAPPRTEGVVPLPKREGKAAAPQGVRLADGLSQSLMPMLICSADTVT